jgi:hypothetical protein
MVIRGSSILSSGSGILIETLGVGSFPWALFILLILALLVAWRARENGFPLKRRRAES